MGKDRRLYFISVSPFGLLPLMRYIIPLFEKKNSNIITVHVKGFYSYDKFGHQVNLIEFDDVHKLKQQTISKRISKYWKIFCYLIRIALLKRESIIYVIDYQVLAIALAIKKLINKNQKIIYHQFELFDPTVSPKLTRQLQLFVIKNTGYINMAIFPEQNRAMDFLALAKTKTPDVLIFPNTNNIVFSTNNHSHEITGIPENHIVIGHIGSIGTGHYAMNYINYITKNTNPNLSFLFIGVIEEELQKTLKSLALNDKRIVVIKEMPHSELMKYYDRIDVGVILYKATDKNTEFCAPNKLYEYWAHGIPVIAHSLKGLQGLWKHDFQGKLIDFTSYEELNNAINDLSVNGKQHRELLTDYFNSELSVDKYLIALEEKVGNL